MQGKARGKRAKTNTALASDVAGALLELVKSGLTRPTPPRYLTITYLCLEVVCVVHTK